MSFLTAEWRKQAILFIVLLMPFCINAVAQQRIFIDTLVASPFPLNWNVLPYYNFKVVTFYVISENNKAYAYADKSKYLPQLPFKLPKPGHFDYDGMPTWQKVEDGYLVGYDNGEWGGSLFWFSPDGSENYKISADQVQQFVVRNKELLAITEGSNQGIPIGRLIKLVLAKGKWISESYLKLNTISHSITVAGNDLYVMAHKSILKIDEQKNVHVLLDKPIWGSTTILNTSVIICENVLYSGMREGVYKYNLKSGKQEWLSLEVKK